MGCESDWVVEVLAKRGIMLAEDKSKVFLAMRNLRCRWFQMDREIQRS